MGLYFDKDKQKLKVIIDDVAYCLNVFAFVTDFIQLLSDDDYVLQDKHGFYLTVKEGD